MISDLFDDDWLKSRLTNGDWSPAVNVIDNEDSYEVELAVPGLKKDDFSASIENGVLTITAKSEKESEEKKKNYTRKEFSSRSFTRSFTLPDNVKEEDVEAKYTDGVLKVKLAKTEKVAPSKKQVAIQ